MIKTLILYLLPAIFLFAAFYLWPRGKNKNTLGQRPELVGLSFCNFKTFRKQKLDEFLLELNSSFDKPKPSFDMSKVKGLDFKSHQDLKKVLGLVAGQYGLKCPINLTISKDKMSADNGRASAAAWVYVDQLSRMDTLEFSTSTVQMFLHESQITGESVDVSRIVNIFSHECAHIVLYASRNKYKESEIMTDMLAIHQGFDQVYLTVNKLDVSKWQSTAWSLLYSEAGGQLHGASEYASKLEKLYVVMSVQHDKFRAQLDMLKSALKMFSESKST